MKATVTVDQTVWKTTGRGPHVSVAGFLFDELGRFPVLYRGPNVRSVKNCWSLPSGLHENGLSMAEQLAMEGMEELNVLTTVDTRHVYLGVYENIVHGEQWHWVVNMLALFPCDLRYLKNSEPDKHPEMTLAKFKNYEIVRCDTEEPITNWGPGLKDWIDANRHNFERLEWRAKSKPVPGTSVDAIDIDRPGVRSLAHYTHLG